MTNISPMHSTTTVPVNHYAGHNLAGHNLGQAAPHGIYQPSGTLYVGSTQPLKGGMNPVYERHIVPTFEAPLQWRVGAQHLVTEPAAPVVVARGRGSSSSSSSSSSAPKKQKKGCCKTNKSTKSKGRRAEKRNKRCC